MESIMSSKNSESQNIEEFITHILDESDKDTIWEHIMKLVKIESDDAFKHAYQLCLSQNGKERRLGVNILSKCYLSSNSLLEEIKSLLYSMLQREEESELIESIVYALGHRDIPQAIPVLASLKNHPVANVRYAIVMSLLAQEDDESIATLIELSTDPEEHIRDWATFGLGTQIDKDNFAIRAALLARLADEDDYTRVEALKGLVYRHDPRCLESMLIELERSLTYDSDYLCGDVVVAASELPHPLIYAALIELQKALPDKEWLKETIMEYQQQGYQSEEAFNRWISHIQIL
jgi:HEAT repeat protein